MRARSSAYSVPYPSGSSLTTVSSARIIARTSVVNPRKSALYDRQPITTRRPCIPRDCIAVSLRSATLVCRCMLMGARSVPVLLGRSRVRSRPAAACSFLQRTWKDSFAPPISNLPYKIHILFTHHHESDRRVTSILTENHC